MNTEKAREILKKHCAAYGDTKYEPALWVIEALQDAVAQEREACAAVCESIDTQSFGVMPIRVVLISDHCATAIRNRGVE